ncbi:MAG: TROVE domain-containing protein, partial [Planctomycetota bacterium]|nr:TROVE domain-containing protein [Planctomycetota bacterium]
TLFQMIRSGQFGKRSLSASVQRAFQRWLNTASVEKLLSASIGHDPALRDVLRLARPTPVDNSRRALFGWLTDKDPAKWSPATDADLPEQVRLLADFRAATKAKTQIEILDRLHARWDLLADSAKCGSVWAAIARNMGPQALRMNLNTLLRHGVFDVPGMEEYIAGRLSDVDEIRRSRQFPYQYFAAYLNASDSIPQSIRQALQRAADIACGNVPVLAGPVVIGLDVSGSMSAPVTGNGQRGGTSKMRCVDVAALLAAALVRRNPDSVVIPFDTQAFDVRFEDGPRSAEKMDLSPFALAERLAQYGGGGTDCSLPLRKANTAFHQRKFAGVVLVSDNESWVYKDRPFVHGTQGSTGVMTEWTQFVRNQVRLQGEIQWPKLVCIDLQPNQTTQAPDRTDILNVGGFSDAVFDVIAAFLNGDSNRFVTEVESVDLSPRPSAKLTPKETTAD